jgi:hypothetical protein
MQTVESVAVNPLVQTNVSPSAAELETSLPSDCRSGSTKRNRNRFAPCPELSSREKEQIAFQVLTDEFRRDEPGSLCPRRGDIVIFQLGGDLKDGDQVLVTTESDDLTMMDCTAKKDGAGFDFKRILSGANVMVDENDIVGQLVETHYRHGQNIDIGWRESCPVEFGDSSTERTGLALMTTEEALDDGDSVVKAMAALIDLEGFAKVREDFSDTYEDGAEGEYTLGFFKTEGEAKDYALRLLCARMFRAGQLSERQLASDLQR